MSTVSLLPTDTPSVTFLPVRPWPDGVIDALGHDPRSAYVERFWLGILGPSTTWLIRFMANRLDASPEGFDLDLASTAQALVSDCTVASAPRRAVAFAQRGPDFQSLHSEPLRIRDFQPLHSWP